MTERCSAATLGTAPRPGAAATLGTAPRAGATAAPGVTAARGAGGARRADRAQGPWRRRVNGDSGTNPSGMPDMPKYRSCVTLMTLSDSVRRAGPVHMWAEGATAAAVVLLAVLAPATPAAGHSQPLQPSGTAPSQTRATPADLDGAAPAHAAADRATVPDAAALRDGAAPSTDTGRAAPGTAPGAAPDGGAAWQPSDVRPVHHPVPPRQQLTVPDERGPALEVLPFGTGLACLGLGLGLVGLRLRRA